MGPNPRGEVHVSPQGFCEQATEKQSTAREQFQLQMEASSCGTRSQASPKEFFEEMELFCISSVLVVTRS